MVLLKQVKVEDLIKYGIIPELVGRITTILVFNELTLEDKISILKKPEMSPWEKHREIFASMGYTLRIDEGVYETIAKACPKATGARALKSICGSLFEEIEYEPDKYRNGKIIQLTLKLTEKLLEGIEIPTAGEVFNDNDFDSSDALAG